MKNTNVWITTLSATAFLLISTQAFSADFNYSNVGAGGYDVVAYFTDETASRGTGWHVAAHASTTYLFASKKNRKTFMANPVKYLPQYGGYCAYGVAVGKKFYADPTIWKVVDGKLYFNLDGKIQKKFEKDVPGYLTKANTNWPNVRNQNPAGL